MKKSSYYEMAVASAKALLASFVCIVVLPSIICYKIPVAQAEDIDAVRCLKDIVVKYYDRGRELTFVDMSDSADDDIIFEIHRSLHVSIVSRTASIPLAAHNHGYVIFVKTASHFRAFLRNLTKEAEWNPNAKFIVLVDSDENELKQFFETLLEFHVINIVIVNGTHDSDLYTYNPFENNGCGRKFNRIIHYGKCNSPTVTDLFPNKLVTGIRNCTFNVAVPHWPPYSINPSISKLAGIEQSMFRIISKMEHFHINYTYTNDAENFTVITPDMSAVGPLGMLQRNEADVIFGGMMLIKSRADVFDYIYSHLAYVDEIKILVRKASDVQPWKNVYLEFQPAVWMLLIVSFIVYFLFLILVLRGSDKSFVFLMMWDSLLLHGRSLGSRAAVKFAVIMWVWFAYLVNSYYQSNLVSLSTYPAKDYQISSGEDLEHYHLKSCVSLLIQTIMWAEFNTPLENTTDDCHTLIQSIRTVSQEDNLFTIVLYSLYNYNKLKFYDKYRTPLLYEFPPMNKIVYAMYFYKGFPMQSKFDNHALRLRESGLIDKFANDLYYEQNNKHYFHYGRRSFNKVELPWFIYIFGVSLSAFTMALELVAVRKKPIRK